MLKDKIDALFAEAQAKRNAPELAYAVRVGDQVVASASTSRPFRIASMSKSFTAAAILMLRDQGDLALDEAVAGYVPQLQSLDHRVTIRQLLTMSSGIATDDPWGDRQLALDPREMDALFETGAYFAIEPGTGFVYSNYGYAMLGRVIDNLIDGRYQDFVTKNLLRPLGMNATTYAAPAEFAAPHPKQEGEDVELLGDGGFGAMGGLWSTVDDLLRWTDFLLLNVDGPLNEASRLEMQQPQRYVGRTSLLSDKREMPAASSYGMGLAVNDIEDFGLVVQHSGGLPGYGSNMLWSPSASITVISLANITYAWTFPANLDALDLIRTNGEWPEPVLPYEVQPYVEQLVGWFNGKESDEVFADNVNLDQRLDLRREAFAGVEFRIASIEPVNGSQANAILQGSNGQTYRLTMSLSSQNPPLIQAYRLTPVV